MRFQQSCRMAVWLVIAPLLLGGCSILREFGPVVEVHTLDAGEAIELKRGDILTRGKLSVSKLANRVRYRICRRLFTSFFTQ